MNRFAACTAALLLAACAAAPVQYYRLPDSSFLLPEGNGEETALRVVLAEPLDKGGLVYQSSELQLNFARSNLWAAPLDSALSARLANELNRTQNRYRFVPAERSSAGRTLTVYIDAFYGSYRGSTLVQGYSLWPDGSGRNFRVETPQQGDGYSAMLQSLSQGLGQAARDIGRH